MRPVWLFEEKYRNKAKEFTTKNTKFTKKRLKHTCAFVSFVVNSFFKYFEKAMDFDDLSYAVIGCALEVHKNLGPGLLESTYEQCIAHELQIKNINFKLQHPVAVNYKGVKLDCGYRVDLIVESELIVELKSVDKLIGIHEAQLLTYMKLANIKKGLLINFNQVRLKEGIKRFVL